MVTHPRAYTTFRNSVYETCSTCTVVTVLSYHLYFSPQPSPGGTGGGDYLLLLEKPPPFMENPLSTSQTLHD